MAKSQKRGVKKTLKKAQEKARERQLSRLIAEVQPKIDVDAERLRPRLVAILFCMFVSKDAEGRHNLLGCFDRIFPDPVTKETGQFYLVVRTAETREKGVVVTFLDPSNRVVAAVVFDKPQPMPTETLMHLEYFGAVGLTTTTEGSYWVDVSYQGKSIGGESLTVEFRKPPATEEKK